jgi:hypothetical protein
MQKEFTTLREMSSLANSSLAKIKTLNDLVSPHPQPFSQREKGVSLRREAFFSAAQSAL